MMRTIITMIAMILTTTILKIIKHDNDIDNNDNDVILKMMMMVN